MINFSISELIIDPSEGSVNLLIADKLIRYHIAIIQPIRDKLGCPVFASQQSGYRSVEWEKAHGRSGGSQHCFSQGGLGAVDWTAGDVERTKLLWVELKKSAYKRVCYYPNNNFIHCDHKELALTSLSLGAGNNEALQLRFICKDGINWISEV